MQQYGLRLRDELEDMTFPEFLYYLYALNEKTPLGKLVNIRTENDMERLKQFTPEMNRIRIEWKNKQAKKVSEEEANAADEYFKNLFMGDTPIVSKTRR